MAATQKMNFLTLVSYSLLQTLFRQDVPFCHNTNRHRQTDRQTNDTLDHTIRKYAHGLLLESPFVPSSTDCWAIPAKIRQKRPSRWPQRQNRKQKYGGDQKNQLFDPGFLFTSSDSFWLGRTILPQYKTSQRTDDTVYQRLDRQYGRPKTIRPNFTKSFAHDGCGCGQVLL